ncbi:MAG: hypothetical protein K2W85_14960 [Phycisphaerales bacterium]|nr:hypothetical protein [Phycisphaerales bacterium]
MSSPQTCTLNRSWLLKIGVFMLVLMGFGTWAVLDAVWLYPARGLSDASVKLRDWVVAAEKAGKLRTDVMVVTDPGAERSRLKGKEEELRSAARGETMQAREAQMELAKLEWLDALARAWRLNTALKPLGELKGPDRTLKYDMTKAEGVSVAKSDQAKSALSLQALSGELTAVWNTTKQPKPLSGFDMPVQFLFIVLGYGLGLYLLFLLVKAKAMAGQFQWDESAQRLTLPGGASFVPTDIEDLDKRLWHKYYVTIITKSGSHKLDLLRYVPLEDWVLAMEKTRFPERVAEEEAAKAAEAGDAGQAKPE